MVLTLPPRRMLCAGCLSCPQMHERHSHKESQGGGTSLHYQQQQQLMQGGGGFAVSPSYSTGFSRHGGVYKNAPAARVSLNEGFGGECRLSTEHKPRVQKHMSLDRP